MNLLIGLKSLEFIDGIYTALTSEEAADLQETCCAHGEAYATSAPGTNPRVCSDAKPPDDLDEEQVEPCIIAVKACCQKHIKKKKDCAAGMKLAPLKKCAVPKSDIGKICCEECSLGRWTGESQGKEACGDPPDEYVSPASALRKNAYHQCCTDQSDISSRKQWRVAQRLADMFWGRWLKEALPCLLPRTMKPGSEEDLQVGDVVLVVDPSSERGYWPRGLVEAVHPGADGRVRVADVRTSRGTLRRRSVQRLARLPTHPRGEAY
ncbi:unnamed protein product [Plutella xylostella]|uniref:(diamondback moth) hypothetical protein n=1 Tax=Plutella xylostella TaxID=51655 RepID=A0A8S4E313_PLUXY|nr:unnamed protein product [Plutella xylostella]